jgi:TonB family protein
MAVQPSTLKKRIKTMKNATPNLPSFRWSISIMLAVALMITGLMACSDVSDNGITEADVQQTQANIGKAPAGNAPLFIVNGEKMNTPEKRNIVSRIKPKYIKSINVLKDKKAVQAYGEAGKNGVVKIKVVDKKQAFNDLAAHARNSTAQMNPHKKRIFVAVQQPPILKGGLAALQKKVKYPRKCREAGIEGRVVLRFIINKQGVPTHIQVVKGIGHGCDQAAVQAVKKYARFKPGRQSGKPVLVRYTLPIMFSLSGKSSAKQSTASKKGHIIGQDMEIRNNSALPNGTLTGVLYSKKTNKPLPGANIRVINTKTGEATTKGAATAENGRFTLNVNDLKENPVKIKITYTGYKPMMIKFYKPVSSGEKGDLLPDSHVSRPIP